MGNILKWIKVNIQYTKKLQDIAKSVPGGKTDNIKYTNEERLWVNNLRLYLKTPIKKKKQMKSKASRKKKMQEQKSMKQKLEKQNETKKLKIRFFINTNKTD